LDFALFRVANTESRISTTIIRFTGLRQYGGTCVSFGVVMLCGLVEVYGHFGESICFRRRASDPRKHVGIFELWSRCGSVVVMFGLRAGRSRVQIPEGARDFYLLQRFKHRLRVLPSFLFSVLGFISGDKAAGP